MNDTAEAKEMQEIEFQSSEFGEKEEQIEAEAEVEEQEVALHSLQNPTERRAVIEALIFVSDEPLTTKTIADVLKEDRQAIDEAVNELAEEFNARNGGLQLREVAGG